MSWLHKGLRIVRGRVRRGIDAAARARDLRAALRDPRPLVLLATNDLSRSGAPLLVFEMAQLLLADGYAPLVVSPVRGPFAARLRAIGVRVLVDGAVEAAPAWLLKLADRARWVLCNTVATAGVAAALAPRRPTLWYLHEVSLLEARLARAEVRAAIDAVALLWAGSALCADKLHGLRPEVAVVPYGVAPLGDPPAAAPSGPLRIGVFGSIERRKGQDLAVAAMASLSAEERGGIALTLYGRILEPDFAEPVLAEAARLGIRYAGELDHLAYTAAMTGTDAVLVSSRDDTLPLVSIDALGSGRMLLLSPDVGTAAWLEPEVSVLVAPDGTPAGFAALLRCALARKGDVPAIGAAARQAFDRHFSRDAFRQRLREACAALDAGA
jgi:glycosyltransferase involved in cell wall biosynthesis